MAYQPTHPMPGGRFYDHAGVLWSDESPGHGNIGPSLRWLLMILSGCVVGLAIVASTYFTNSPKLAVALLGGIGFVLLTIRWPEIGVLGLLGVTNGLVDVGWLPPLRLGPVSLQTPEMILGFLLALTFFRATTRSGVSVFSSPLCLPLLLFFGAVVVSAANAILVSHVPLNDVFRSTRILIQWLIFFPVIGLIRDERTLKRLIAGLWLFAGLLALGAIFPNALSRLHVLPVSVVELDTAGRTFSGVTRVFLAGEGILRVMILVALASLAATARGRQLWRLGVLGLLLFWLFRSYQRNFWLTAGLSSLLTFVFLANRERTRLLKRTAPAAAVGLLLLAALLVLQPGNLDRQFAASADRLGSMMQDLSRTDASIQWRDMENFYGMRQVSEHPVFGIGIANTYRPPMVVESDTTDFATWSHRFIHNSYLWILVMMGLIGLLPFLWLCVFYVYRSFRYAHTIRDGNFRSVYLGFGAAFVGLMVSNMVAPHFVQSWALVTYPVMMGTSEVIFRLNKVN